MIKPKIGKCITCYEQWEEEGSHSGKEPAMTPLIAKKCQTHYGKHRSEVNGAKQKEGGKKSHLSPKSKKQIDRDIAYAKLRKSWLPDHPKCEANLTGCQKGANQVHHMQGRSGELLTDTSKWLAVCHNCHRWITDNSSEAILLGLSLIRNN